MLDQAATQLEPKMVPIESIRFVKELYPRLKPHDEVIQRYRNAIDNLPPIMVARDGILVDGYHRWQAHVREERQTIETVNLGNLADVEIWRASIEANSIHGEQLSVAEKKKEAIKGWGIQAHLSIAERIADLAKLFGVSRDAVERWTKDARAEEKRAVQDRAYDLWLDCYSQRDIAEIIGREYPAFAGTDHKAIGRWVDGAFSASAANAPPDSRQHFDIWQFATADQDAGSQSYFGAMPPQVVENLLWFFTEPGDIVVDPFAGSGTTVDVAKAMGRRVWASDIRGNHYSPHLPIHKHDITTGWPDAAPGKADLVFLDPPYWKQASGRYSAEPNELAEWTCVHTLNLPGGNSPPSNARFKRRALRRLVPISVHRHSTSPNSSRSTPRHNGCGSHSSARCCGPMRGSVHSSAADRSW